MRIDDVRVASEPRVLATAEEVDAWANRRWLTLPPGYHEYVTKLGDGVLAGFVRIYLPWRIDYELDDWRSRLKKYWFWDDGRDVLPKERALECVIVGDTLSGDELVFHPCRPDRLFVLPRDSEQVFEAGPDLLSAADWMCQSGELTDSIIGRDFEPSDSRTELAAANQDSTPADPEGESLDEIAESVMQWAKRHKALYLAKKDLKSQVKGGTKAKSLFQAFVIEGRFPYEPGYTIAWQIVDEASGLEVGVFQWRMGNGSHGFAFTPNKANTSTLNERQKD